jgi:putative oxidoreductase
MTTTLNTRVTTTEAGARTTTGRRAHVALWVLQVLAALVFVTASLPKLAASEQAVQGFADIGFGVTGMYVIGVLELLGAIGLLVPRLCGLAGAALVALMVGAVLVTWLTLGPAMVAMPGVTLVVVAVIAWGRRGRTVELVRRVRSLA